MAAAFPASGFSFKNCFRNKVLEEKKIKAPQPYKTGTTISAAVYKDGVVLGADTRATEDPMIVDGNCEKIHYLADNIYCCGAGTVADAEAVTRIISAQLELMRLNTGHKPRVCCTTRMMKQMLYRYQGCVSAALIVGGVDVTGPHVVCIYPHGSTHVLPYATMGSGAMAAMAIFETRYKPDMQLHEAEKLVRDSILAGIDNDLGSGANIDLCIVQKDSATYQRHFEESYVKGDRQGLYIYEPGTTSIIMENVEKLDVVDSQIFRLDNDNREED